jgi:hypothetical protein
MQYLPDVVVLASAFICLLNVSFVDGSGILAYDLLFVVTVRDFAADES